MITVGIIGGSGYAGGELLRLLFFHPKVKVEFVTSEKYQKIPIGFIHPNLRVKNDLKFISLNEVKKKVDVVFFALPNGVSQKLIDQVKDFGRVLIDLGADFRLENEDEWQKWYKTNHLKGALLKKFVYGLPEVYREKIKKAKYIAIPGCEATVSILTLFPAVKNKLIYPSPIIIDAKMSSSQSGKNFSLATHHPERAGAVRSYSPSGHRHTAEIEMVLKKFDSSFRVDISATAIEMVRGILVTIHCFLKEKVEEKDIWRAYRKFTQENIFVRLVKQEKGLYRYPEPKILFGSNYCDIGFEIDQRSQRLVLIGAIDNLVKGTAGQAIQCLNLVFGLREDLGLEFPGLHPI